MGSTKGQVINCKAAVAWAPKQAFVIEEIQVAPPLASEVRIKITHTSVCHTDVSIWQIQELADVFPRIFGHEASGIVESVGEGVIDLQVGDHVIPIFQGECGDCTSCKSSKTNLCEEFTLNPGDGLMKTDRKTRFSIRGQPIFHFFGTSTFSEYTVIHRAQVVKVDPAAPLNKICLLGCGITTGVGAVLKTAKVEAGSTVAIFGLGAVGLAVAEGARIAGASKVIGVDINPRKFNKGKLWGITECLNPLEYDQPIHQVIQQKTGGGVDYSFECVGNVDVMRTAYDSCHKGWGVSVVVGVDTSSRKLLQLTPVELLEGRIWTGTVFGGIKGRSQLPELVDKYMKKELQIDEMITHTLPFSEINEALKLLIEGNSLRCVMHMHNSEH
ncbi:hypothetical protein O6H91_04G051400 [Diphasiastrum complanatum]|nr:hypothetical protein O6H91_04G050800 [Diphasiastrum complanatum]KAJ7558675.1 hypothetical protein O6H91_04G050800 [Diphasiastrum complanatum]KAJ7558676.1 hypothetical protein O6H91_04G050800 [Diphasiastrum complanatum]KAJ7558677.1 hypothetical protein O6H91_04G050800 [Diphasiastrum complanatum]KAJ7558678.1 hypothetical protein O6H91_04G050800 [Diphasiastrum complanatum]